MPKGVYNRTKPVWNKGMSGIYSDESIKKMSESRKGRTPWNKGKTGVYSVETRKSISISQLGRTAWNKGIPRTETEKVNISISRRGKKQWNWKGGVTPLHKKIRVCFEYKQWRTSIFRRDNYTCQSCKNVGGEINADHIHPFSAIINENNIKSLKEALDCVKLWDTRNGRTLCVDCHKKTPTYGRKARHFSILSDITIETSYE